MNDDDNSSSVELQKLLDENCVEIKLPSYPPPTRTTSLSSSLLVDETEGKHHQDHQAAYWTQRDTENALYGVNYDTTPCGRLKLYLTDPINKINEAIRRHRASSSSNKILFIDYEFCVSEEVSASEITIGNEKCTPGIITTQNVYDFENSGEPKRIARIEHFTSKARRQRRPCNTSIDSSSSSSWVWKRASSMPGKKIFSSFDNSIKAQNVIQGKVGNCGFCSGFASLAAKFQNVITGAFRGCVENTFETCGAISVRVYPRGKQRFILLDDYILCLAGSASSSSPALHSLNENDIWIRLLEKLFVKLQSSYASLDGYYKFNSLYRHPARALQLIANGPIALEVHYTVQQVDEVYKTLLATEMKYVRVAHGRKVVDGLFKGHGYSLLWVGSIAGIRLALLRNPHGKKSYMGEFGRGGGDSWSSIDAISVANELKTILDDSTVGSSNDNTMQCLVSAAKGGVNKDDDGIFLMRFEMFVECFPITTVVGPIEIGGPGQKAFVVKDSIYILPSENISELCNMLKVAER